MQCIHCIANAVSGDCIAGDCISNAVYTRLKTPSLNPPSVRGIPSSTRIANLLSIRNVII